MVLVIIAVVSGFVGPKLAGSLTNMNLKTAAKRVAASLRYARSQAASETTTYLALFDMDRGRVTIAPDEGEAEEGVETHEAASESTQAPARPKQYDLPKTVRIQKGISGEEETTSGLFSIVFFADGGSSGGTVILSNERGYSYSVTVDFITGTVQLGEGAEGA